MCHCECSLELVLVHIVLLLGDQFYGEKAGMGAGAGLGVVRAVWREKRAMLVKAKLVLLVYTFKMCY